MNATLTLPPLLPCWRPPLRFPAFSIGLSRRTHLHVALYPCPSALLRTRPPCLPSFLSTFLPAFIHAFTVVPLASHLPALPTNSISISKPRIISNAPLQAAPPTVFHAPFHAPFLKAPFLKAPLHAALNAALNDALNDALPDLCLMKQSQEPPPFRPPGLPHL